MDSNRCGIGFGITQIESQTDVKNKPEQSKACRKFALFAVEAP
jgi:hypothetical protein